MNQKLFTIHIEAMKKIICSSLLALACIPLMPAQEYIVLARMGQTTTVQQDSVLVIATIAPMTFVNYQDSFLVTTEPYYLLIASQEDSTTFLPALNRIEGISVYPNPTHDRLTLQKEDVPFALNIELFDTKGILLNTYSWPEHMESLQPNLTSLTSGTYFIRISNLEKTKGNIYKILKR